MGVLVLAYYQARWTRPWFDRLAQAKHDYGYVFSMVAAMVAGGLVPEVLKIVFFQRGRPVLHNVRELVFTMTFWGITGFTVDLFYRLQTVWFGSGIGWSTLLAKVLVDQFVYSTIYAVPAVTWAYEWKDRGFRLHGLSDLFTPAFYAARIFPTLLANWSVWIPVVTLIYLLPPLLQTPLFTLALSFWVLIVTYITSSRRLAHGASSGHPS